MIAVRRYLGCGLSYCDVEVLLAERRITVDHVTIHRRVQRFTPLLIDAARPCRHADQAPAYPPVIEELTAAACHVTKLYANPGEADH